MSTVVFYALMLVPQLLFYSGDVTEGVLNIYSADQVEASYAYVFEGNNSTYYDPGDGTTLFEVIQIDNALYSLGMEGMDIEIDMGFIYPEIDWPALENSPDFSQAIEGPDGSYWLLITDPDTGFLRLETDDTVFEVIPGF